MPLDNFIDGFVKDTAERGRSLIGSVFTKVSDKWKSSGPLAALSENKFAISKLQYPINLGDGPNLSYIKFSILKSVGVDGANSTQFAGTANKTRQNSQVQQIVNDITTGAVKAGNALSDLTQSLGVSGDSISKVSQFFKDQGLTSAFTTQRRVVNTDTVIALYMPPTMVFSQTNGYTDFSYTHSLGTALLGAESLKTAASGEQIGASVTEAAGSLFGNDIRSAALYGFQGRALNPQVEVLYQETPLRTFQFEFVLAARSKEEALQIKKIIEAFRMAAAPSYEGNGEAGRYLIPPDEFEIEFYFDRKQMESVPRISTCVLQTVTTDFAPSGQFTTFADGEPMSVRMTMEFKEVELITKQRVEQGF